MIVVIGILLVKIVCFVLLFYIFDFVFMNEVEVWMLVGVDCEVYDWLKWFGECGFKGGVIMCGMKFVFLWCDGRMVIFVLFLVEIIGDVIGVGDVFVVGVIDVFLEVGDIFDMI